MPISYYEPQWIVACGTGFENGLKGRYIELWEEDGQWYAYFSAITAPICSIQASIYPGETRLWNYDLDDITMYIDVLEGRASCTLDYRILDDAGNSIE